MNKVKWLEETCNNCGCQINSWDKRISKTLAYRYPNCEKCIAEEYDMNVEDLRERMERFFGMRPCMVHTATFCGQQGRIFRTVRAILNGQPGISAGQRVLRPTDQY